MKGALLVMSLAIGCGAFSTRPPPATSDVAEPPSTAAAPASSPAAASQTDAPKPGASGPICPKGAPVAAQRHRAVGSVEGDDAFRSLLAQLAAVSTTRIGAVGGGPVMPSPDTLLARQLVKAATPAQLVALLDCDNGAVRAHVAREILRGRPEEAALTCPLLSDPFVVTVGSMADHPPIVDGKETIGQLVAGGLRELSWRREATP
jgi:hypothetical protein